MLPLLLVYLLPYQNGIINSMLAGLFLAFSFTDFLDGYLARKYKQTTKLGGALDHIADKLLTASTFIGLLAVGYIYFFWVILFIGRDIFIMGLRQIALEHGFSVPVGYVGKAKTLFQMLLITLLILQPYRNQQGDQAFIWQTAEQVLLYASIFFTLFSAYLYYKAFMRQFGRKHLVQIEP